MARYRSDDYIQSYGDIEAKRSEADARAQAARDRGFRLGEYEISYTYGGTKYTDRVTAYSKAEAVEQLKQTCGLVGMYPYDMVVKTLVEPNVYV